MAARPKMFWPFARRPLTEPSALEKSSFAAGRLSGQDPATPYGFPTPEGLDPVAFAAGLIEGRASVMSRGHRALRRWQS